MDSKRDPKYGEILKCASRKCKKEAFFYEACESWTRHKGKHYCFKCSVDHKNINFRDQFLTFRTAELNRRRKKA